MNGENENLELTDEEVQIILALRTPGIGDIIRSLLNNY